MVLEEPGSPLRAAELPRPEPGARRGADPRPRVRGLPHRPARARRRGPRAPSDRPRPPDHRHGRGDGGARRRAVAGLDGRHLPLLHQRPREPLRQRAVHRRGPQRRLRRVHGRRPALLLPDPGGLPRPPGGAAAVRGADRAPRAADDRRRRAARALRLRRLRPHRRPGRAAPGPARVRVHARGRQPAARTSRARSAPSGRGSPASGRRRSSTRRSSSRPPGRSSRSRCARSPRAAPWSAPGST